MTESAFEGRSSLAEFDTLSGVFPPSLLPRAVAVVSVATPTAIGQNIHWAEWKSVASASPRRIAEFGAGRSCARAALAQLGVRHGAIPSLPCRAPQWPAGFVGSITHTEGCYAAAVARRTDFVGLGIDAEPMIPLSPELATRVLTYHEQQKLQPLGSNEWLSWATIAFSAKESVYKMYNSLTMQSLEFQDVEVAFDRRGVFEARLVRSFHPAINRNRVFDGSFKRSGRLVYTATWTSN